MRTSISLTMLAVVAAACGDDADPGCPTPVDAAPGPDTRPIDPLCAGAQCGGDLTGTWDVIASCARGSGDGSFFNCPEGTVDLGDDFHVRGRWTFAADGSVTTDVSEHATAIADLPLSCYGFAECAPLEALAAASGIVAECADVGPVDETTCAVVPESCDCGVVIDDDMVMLQATIVTDPAGTFELTLGNETIPGEYCVNGDELWMHGVRFGGVDYQYRFRRVTP